MDNIRNFIKGSVIFKIASIGLLILILLIPTTMVRSLVNERKHRKRAVINEITSKWGQEQVIGGPVLTIPYEVHYEDREGEVKTRLDYAYFLPENLNISGNIDPEIRYRSIYKAVVYNSHITLKGKFKSPNFTKFNIDKENIRWKDAFLSIGISDMVGIKEQIKIDWNKESYIVEPGSKVRRLFQSGININLPITPGEEYQFATQLNINGSQELMFYPFGKFTEVELSSDWSNPSFKGNFLPISREISEEGFEVRWKVLNLNRNYPQQWKSDEVDAITKSIYNSKFGVDLLLPVDHYQQTTRSIKYGIIFIFLTFLVFFFVEILNKLNIHPIQYLLVGFSMVIFYLLLLSLSEYLQFGFAYIIASISNIVLIALYARSVFKQDRLAILIGGILTLLYGYLYILLESQDYSLLMGSIGIFIILAIVMYLSRDIDWYQINSMDDE